MANLSVTWDSLKARVGVFIGYGDNVSSAWSTEQESQIEQIVNDGYQQWLGAPNRPDSAYRWSFLSPRYEMLLTAPYTTGTIGITAGVVTLTGGTFPSWAAQGRLVVSGGSYDISTRDGNTQVTLNDTSVSLTSGAEYSLQRVTYDLPANFGSFGEGPLTLANENLADCKSIQRVNESMIRRMKDYGALTGPPRMASHFIKEVSNNTTDAYQQWVIEFYPIADAAYVVEFTYEVLNDALSDTNTRPLGNQRYHESLIASCLAMAELQVYDGQSRHWRDQFQMRLAQAVAYDKTISRPRNYGKMRDGSDNELIDFDDWERPTDTSAVYTYP